MVRAMALVESTEDQVRQSCAACSFSYSLLLTWASEFTRKRNILPTTIAKSTDIVCMENKLWMHWILSNRQVHLPILMMMRKMKMKRGHPTNTASLSDLILNRNTNN